MPVYTFISALFMFLNQKLVASRSLICFVSSAIMLELDGRVSTALGQGAATKASLTPAEETVDGSTWSTLSALVK